MTQPHYPRGFCPPDPSAVLIHPVIASEDWQKPFDAQSRAWLDTQGFLAQAGSYVFFPHQGTICVALGLAHPYDWRSWADAASQLPAGIYRTTHRPDPAQIRGWGSGSYRYRKTAQQPKLCCPKLDTEQGLQIRAERMTRFLIDHPANLLTTTRLARYARRFLEPIAPALHTETQEIIGDDLLKCNFPLVHAVGRASEHPPRLLDICWNSPDDNPNAPLVTLIGKGVCFDTGGLDIKPRTAMLNMKKDMGGAAHAVGLAAMILASRLHIRLRLILGIAENAISASAMRPKDILRARNGDTIEIGDTDAEGRLILADCLCYAAEEKSDLVLDFATLTGAARVALGTDLPALFSNDTEWAHALCAESSDPLWRMPLHAAYAKELKGSVSTLNSAPGGGYGGAITAALFLEHFVPGDTSWAHIDLMAYAPSKIHGRSAGGAAQGLYACLSALQERYSG